MLSLVKSNTIKFTLSVFLFLIELFLAITSPLFTNWIIENYLNQEKDNTLLMLILILLGYKLFKTFHSIVLDICYQTLGFQYFAILYHHVLMNYETLNGKILNLIEYDCNMVINFCYSMLSSIFSIIELTVIVILMVYYIQQTQNLYLFFIIIILYVFSQITISVLTFKYNKIYLNGKDNRLSSNIDFKNNEQILDKRKK